MLIFLAGPDSYRRRKELKKIIEEENKKGALIERFDFDEAPTEAEAKEIFYRAVEFAGSTSLFGGKKLAVVEGVFEWYIPEVKSFLKSAIKADNFTVILSAESAWSKYSFLKGKSVAHRKFEYLKDAALRSFIAKEAIEAGVKLSAAAVSALAVISKGNSWLLITELQKLALCPAAQQGELVDVKDIETLGDFREPPNLFAFINGIERLGPRAKIQALEELFLAREEPAKIFNILAAGRYLSRNLLMRLADYDVAVKSGKLEYEEVLLELALTA